MKSKKSGRARRSTAPSHLNTYLENEILVNVQLGSAKTVSEPPSSVYWFSSR
jgi:hypothetical protein